MSNTIEAKKQLKSSVQQQLGEHVTTFKINLVYPSWWMACRTQHPKQSSADNIRFILLGLLRMAAGATSGQRRKNISLGRKQV
jgi:hypothetical protein